MDDLEITTLENAVYMNYKNDVSFVFDSELMLYEHQSTVNPNMPLAEAVESAVDYCIEQGILSEFLRANRAEVIAMCLYEFDEKAYLQNEREYWYEEGVEEGLQRGHEQGLQQGLRKGEIRLAELLRILMDAGRTEDVNRVVTDPIYREQLYHEYELEIF